MPPGHHPSSRSLADFVVGSCSPGAAFLIGRHLEYCPLCASRVQAMGPVSVSAGDVPDEKISLPCGTVLTLTHASGLGEIVYQLEVQPRQVVPLNEPFVAEEVLVLKGGALGGGATYSPGDLLTLDETLELSLVSHPELGCVCIVAACDPSGLAVEGLGGADDPGSTEARA